MTSLDSGNCEGSGRSGALQTTNWAGPGSLAAVSLRRWIFIEFGANVQPASGQCEPEKRGEGSAAPAGASAPPAAVGNRLLQSLRAIGLESPVTSCIDTAGGVQSRVNTHAPGHARSLSTGHEQVRIFFS